ncbi:hypothetical protein EC991_005667 [Linnemannia zychae]|nr:hypothetical protein EC991_005667 [Linnemannia zychae]
MRLTTVSLTLSLAFAFLASAAPAPQHEKEHIPGGPPPATLPAAPAPGGTPDGPQRHKDVTEGSTDDDDEDDNEDDQEENGEVGSSITAEVEAGVNTKVLHGKGKGKEHVKTVAKEAVGLTLTPEEINRMQQSYKDDEGDVNIIPAPAGGEDDSEWNDDPSDY